MQKQHENMPGSGNPTDLSGINAGALAAKQKSASALSDIDSLLEQTAPKAESPTVKLVPTTGAEAMKMLNSSQEEELLGFLEGLSNALKFCNC